MISELTMLESKEKLGSSFRDPAGFLFNYQGELFRQINPEYFSDYQYLMKSGLYQQLSEAKMLIPHLEVEATLAFSDNALVIKPKKIPFISYPYEWSFSQLKDAALLTLKVQLKALEYGMTLKDASGYNIQFYQGRAIFIDTLSFTQYQEGSPWQGYRQFCQHFLAPLMLMCFSDVRLNQLLKIYIDGIPLDLASKLLPTSTKLKLSPLVHIHMHAKLQRKYKQSQKIKQQSIKLTSQTLNHLINGLIHAVSKLNWNLQKNSEWFDYYEFNNNYTTQALSEKEKVIADWVKQIKPDMLWDLGANTGRFSTIAAKYSKQVIAWDIDTSCVENFYQQTCCHSANILPLTLDLTNPSNALGWGHHERLSFLERGPANAVLALGLIHHIAIVNNVPFDKIAVFFCKLTEYLIIEFIPKIDSQVQKLLATRKDIFDGYTAAEFENTFTQYFDLLESLPLKESHRTLYFLKRKKAELPRYV